MEHLAYLMSHFCIPNVSFLCQKEIITFKRTKTSHYFFTLRVRNLNSRRYFEVYCLYCPIRLSKDKKPRCKTYWCLPLQWLLRLVTQRHLFSVGENARCVMTPKNGCKRDIAYCRSSDREKIKIIGLQLVT